VGEHTAPVLSDALAMTPGELAELAARGIIGPVASVTMSQNQSD
jgi:hypothetical protein